MLRTALLGLACSSGAVVAAVVDVEDASALQAVKSTHGRGAALLQETMRAESDEVHVTFVTDCHPHEMWQSEMLFFSAQRVGQKGPITHILSGCSPEEEEAVKKRQSSLGLPDSFKVNFVPKYNTRESHVINKVYGFGAWFRNTGPERDVVALIDPDFIFINPLTARLDDAKDAFGWNESQIPAKVEKGVVVAQRWPMIYGFQSQKPWVPPIKKRPDDLAELSDGEILTWVCSGDSKGKTGCAGVTQAEASTYHSTGVPYMAHREDLEEWLVKDWEDITTRLHQVYDGYYIDMWSWMLTPLHHGTRQVAANYLQLHTPNRWERWSTLEEKALNPCDADMDELFSNPDSAKFIHYCQPDHAWNKYWFDQWHQKGEHVFQRCDAAADDERLSKLLAEDVNMTAGPVAFIPCIARRFFAASLMRACAGQPAAEVVSKIAAGFKL